MLEIRARSSRDGQVESDLVPTAGGIRPDSTIFCCKGADHWEVIRCRRGSGLEEERVL